MGSSKAFGTNGMPDFDGGLTDSLLDSATLSTALEDNSALLGISRELNNTVGTDPLSSGLNRLVPKDTKAGNNSSKSNQDLLTNPTSSIDYTNNDSLLFNQLRSIANIPSQPLSSKSTKDEWH